MNGLLETERRRNGETEKGLQHRFLSPLLTLLLLAGGVMGCGEAEPSETFVARVGTAVLTTGDLEAALQTVPARQDSAEVRRQIIDQWVRNELLYQEAVRRNLRDEASVQRRLEESERAVLIDALLSRLYEEQVPTITPAQVRSYFEQHKEQLRLREPFVRVRYLATAAPDSAQAARRLLQQATARAAADSLWPRIVERFAGDVVGSLALGQTYFPESRLFSEQPVLSERLDRLRAGEIAPVLGTGGAHHLLQLVDRAEAGSVPELPWVEDEVRRQLAIEGRKQMFQRQVERLRTEAQSRNALEVR